MRKADERRLAGFLIAAVSIVGCGVQPSSDPSTDGGVTADAAAAAPGGGVAAGPAGKRVPPPDPAPVTMGELRIEAVHWGRERGLDQNGGYIAAFDTATGRELWMLKVYDVVYDPELESDVQDVFIASLAPADSAGLLVVDDERGRRWTVDVRTRTVRRR